MGPGGAAKGRIPTFFFKKRAPGARLASDRAYRRFGPKLRRDARFFSSDLTSMIKKQTLAASFLWI
tara:strand:- start:291 stop:488 length:198 start_codon:yes stop_codon:yes gene_type:complete